jgi:hypothetical protein
LLPERWLQASYSVSMRMDSAKSGQAYEQGGIGNDKDKKNKGSRETVGINEVNR